MKLTFTLVSGISFFYVSGQTSRFISGKIENDRKEGLASASIHLKGSHTNTISDSAGFFKLAVNPGNDSLEISHVGFESQTIAVNKNTRPDLLIQLKTNTGSLTAVVIGSISVPAKPFMQKVIEQKNNNNPARIEQYSYRRYTRNELDIDRIDFEKSKGRGLKSLMLKTYSAVDSNAKTDRELPVYFTEHLASHDQISAAADRETVIAHRDLGLKTDSLLNIFTKFYMQLNIYDDWLPVFDQTYVSPLNKNAFQYYKYFTGDTISEDGKILKQVRFAPLHAYEKTFSGVMWINTATLTVESVEMHLSKTSDLNFISDIEYNEKYADVFDSVSKKTVSMPAEYSSEIRFQTGLQLLGIPVPAKQNHANFLIRYSTVNDRFNLNSLVDKRPPQPPSGAGTAYNDYWLQNRSAPLTPHEENIYKMVDTLKANQRFQRDVKLIAFLGTGYWDFNNRIRIGPYSSFLSHNNIEGWRVRAGIWTMPGISKKINVFGYGAYGSKDKKLKGMAGIKYLWNSNHWTKSTLTYGADYDFVVEQNDELDGDNIINSLIRKNIPYYRTYNKQILLQHEQYISHDLSAAASVGYRELSPVFKFKYRTIDEPSDTPDDNIFSSRLPVAEFSAGIRYAHKERLSFFNYDKNIIGTFYPVITGRYTYGFEAGKAEFVFHKIDIGIEQRLHLPPKSMLYYHLEAGKVFGTVPYILLDIPRGNEYYVASRYLFNTMTPYEFAANRYISLHSRFYPGGSLLDKIPLLKKLGWRERVSFNAYAGGLNTANTAYNKNSDYHLLGSKPFMETGIGIENIFRILSVEYYRRLDYLSNPYAKKDGIYMGVTLIF